MQQIAITAGFHYFWKQLLTIKYKIAKIDILINLKY